MKEETNEERWGRSEVSGAAVQKGSLGVGWARDQIEDNPTREGKKA